MGEYFTLFNQIKSYIYNGRADAAKDTLKRLLNSLNIDYSTAKNPAEKDKVRKAIMRLLPALDDLKTGRLSPRSLSALQLDGNRVPAALGGNYVQPAAASKPYSLSSCASPQPPRNGGKPTVRNGNAFMPLTLDDYIGQEKAKRSLRISIGAARKTGRPLAHLLICSSYGLGKTTLANIIANEMGMPFFNVNATNLKDVRSLSLYFSKIDRSCIVFIDEIHTLKKEVQTVLLSIMTDFTVNFIDETGEEEHYDLPPFTLIGATTQAGELLKPFLNRFSVLELEDYTEEEKLVLVRSKFIKSGYEATEEAVAEVAGRCRGVPRTIETYVKGIVDVALSRDETVISKVTSDIYFDIHEIDGMGLTKNDRKLLAVLDEADKPLALVTLESKIGIQKEDLEYRYEPYLLKIGFVDKTDRGRVITVKGRRYLHPDGGDGQTEKDCDGEPSAETPLPPDGGDGQTEKDCDGEPSAETPLHPDGAASSPDLDDVPFPEDEA